MMRLDENRVGRDLRVVAAMASGRWYSLDRPAFVGAGRKKQMDAREGTSSQIRGNRMCRLLLVGPRVIDNDIVGGSQVQFEQMVSALRGRGRVHVGAVISTARPLSNRTRVGKLLLDAKAFLETVVGAWRQAPAVDLIVWYVSDRGAILSGGFVWLVCAVRRRPLCIRFYGGDFDAQLASSRAIWRFIATRTFLKADLLLFETKRLTAVVGASFRAAWHPSTRDTPRRRLSYRKSCRRLLFLSVLDPAKGLPELMEAALRFPPSVRLSVFGFQVPGFDVRTIDTVPNVVYGGPVAPPCVPAILETHDALVLPTRYAGEGYPGVVIEAFQMGLPVIVTRHAALQELVTDGKDGLCVAVGSVDAIVEAVVRMCSDDRLFCQLRRGALETGRRYRNDRAAAQIEGFCGRVAARARDAAEPP